MSLRGSPCATRSSFDGLLASGYAEARRQCLGIPGLRVSTAARSLRLIDHGVGARDETFPTAFKRGESCSKRAEPTSCGYSREAVRAPIFAANTVMYKEQAVGIALIFDCAQA